MDSDSDRDGDGDIGGVGGRFDLPRPALARRRAALGTHVASLADVAADVARKLRGRTAATLPAPDAETRAQQAALLGRGVAPGVLGDADAELADAVIALRLAHDEAAVGELRAAA